MTDKVKSLEDTAAIFHQLYREARFKLKLAHKQIGKQGDTIFHLRCELEEIRGLISKEDRGVYRRIQAQYDDLYAAYQTLLTEHEELQKKLADELVDSNATG